MSLKKIKLSGCHVDADTLFLRLEGTETIDGTAAYRLPVGLLCLLPLSMLVLLFFIPESPAWFMSKGRREAAAASLVKINRSRPDYHPEPDLVVIEDAVQLEAEMESESSWASLIKDPIERRKLFYACGVMFVQQINGIQFWYTLVFCRNGEV